MSDDTVLGIEDPRTIVPCMTGMTREDHPRQRDVSTVADKVSNNSGIDDSGDTTGHSWSLSKELENFYHSHNVTISMRHASSNPYRFIRLNPRYDSEETLRMLEKELNDDASKNVGGGCGEKDWVKDPKLPTVFEHRRPIAVPWLEVVWGFYALPEDFSLASSLCFRSGRIYGMDVSSGAGVAALLTDFYDKEAPSRPEDDNGNAPPGQVRILDLCCCPGLKLLQMADYFSVVRKQPARLAGVDISKSRMDKCKTIVHKYLIDRGTCGPNRPSPDLLNVQLYLQDGATFGGWDELSSRWSGSEAQNLVFDSTAALEEESGRGRRKRTNKSARARQMKRLRQLASTERNRSHSVGKDDKVHRIVTADGNTYQTGSSIHLFDYVLVDAECSTDGSFKHIRERMKEGSMRGQEDVQNQEKNSRLMDVEKLADLVALQKRLIASGFRLLKSGGAMVYSTCSLSTNQNEDVVRWLLQNNEDAYLIPVQFQWVESAFITDGSLAGTVRFSPNLGQESSNEALFGDGFYLAKIGKR
jgi:16S rRNA C967 or C1407 C5-methylase (RsmB/RsmF family)